MDHAGLDAPARAARLARVRVRGHAAGVGAGLFVAAAAQAQAPAPPLPAPALDRAAALASELAQARAPAGARVVASAGAPDPRLRLAPCGDIRALPSPGAPAWGRTRVLLRCAGGPVAWRITLPVVVQVWAPAWVTAAPHAAGDTLRAGQLRTDVVDWAAAATPPLATGEEPVGRTLARALAAGETLREADLRARQWFVAGDTVQVTARGSGFAVTAEAQAITPGVEGRPAQLKAANGRVFRATPVAERRAEVPL